MWEGSEEVMRVFPVVLVLFLASSLLLVPIQGFLASFSKYGSRRQLHPQMSSLDERELAKIFGRLADKMILLDVPGAGTPEMVNCCHGGCDNKCIECEMFFSDIANEINDEMGYDSDDSEYFVEEDIISSCPCNDGTMCTYCHDG